MKYRSRTEIAATILAVANEGATRMRIMYAADVYYTQFSGYIGMLLNKGLLVYDEDDRIYRTTAKGRKFLASKKDQSLQVSRMSKSEIVEKISSILKENKDGLTATQIASLTGISVQGDILRRLRKQGRIKAKKGISAKGRPTLLYITNENSPNA